MFFCFTFRALIGQKWINTIVMQKNNYLTILVQTLIMGQCSPCAYKFDYISKLETLSEDGDYLMEKANFPKEYLELRGVRNIINYYVCREFLFWKWNSAKNFCLQIFDKFRPINIFRPLWSHKYSNSLEMERLENVYENISRTSLERIYKHYYA